MDKSKEIRKLARRIRDLRIKKGYSSYENFAFENGIHRAQYGRYETGTDLQYSSIVKIAKAFDMTLAEFFNEGFD